MLERCLKCELLFRKEGNGLNYCEECLPDIPFTAIGNLIPDGNLLTVSWGSDLYWTASTTADFRIRVPEERIVITYSTTAPIDWGTTVPAFQWNPTGDNDVV
jgi:hypothetical protein